MSKVGYSEEDYWSAWPCLIALNITTVEQALDFAINLTDGGDHPRFVAMADAVVDIAIERFAT